jgi:hypothetical protein
MRLPVRARLHKPETPAVAARPRLHHITLPVAFLLLTLPVDGAGKGAGKSPAKKESTTAILIQMERDWSQAGIAKDTRTMDRIMADDWVSDDFQGRKSHSRAEIGVRPQYIELGDMKVRVFGTTAIVQGKDSDGKYAWMDVFVKRNGHWQAVASQSTKVEK